MPRSEDPVGLLQSWGLSDRGGLSDQMMPPKTGHCVQQDAAISCGDSCVLKRVGHVSCPPPHRSFFFIVFLFFFVVLSMPSSVSFASPAVESL